ncbi:LamG-like jellyroll fold domain-containing protein [Nocardioides sp.]|uniref:LamG-like jellyroll fold domain-containing protein n=1 Tax=Nocardioides sp. TaxID=35761 RepID=UPI0037832BB4
MPRVVARRRLLVPALTAALVLAGAIAGGLPAADAAPTSYPGSVQGTGPAAWYRLGEASGTTMVDGSGNGHDGTYSATGVTLGGAAAIVNETDTSAAFDGTGDGQGPAFAAASSYTLEGWVKRADGADGSIVGIKDSGQLYVHNDQLVLHQTDTDVTGPTLTPGTWYHVAATYQGGTARLWVDGTMVASAPTPTDPFGSNPLQVASGDQAPDFHGQLDEVAYYTHALSASELSDHYAVGADTFAPTISITTPVDNAEYLLHAVPATVRTCTDPGAISSGIRSCDVTGNGTYLGRRFVTVTATDRAGNTASRTVFYSVLPIRYADEIALSNPLVHYRLDDPVGATTATDSSGHGRHGTYKNAVAPGAHKDAAIVCERRPNPPRVCDLAADPLDHSTHFGGEGYIYLQNLAAPQSAYTLEAWIRPDDHGDGSIVGQGGAGQLYVRNGHLALRQTQDDVVSSGPDLTPGVWWHVAATWDGTTTTLYVNGDPVAASSSARKAPSGSATMYVGTGEQAPPFDGDLDEVAYYGTALSPHVLKEHYDIGTVYDWPSIVPMPPNTNTGKPSGRVTSPVDDALYAPTKTPPAHFTCTDPDGPADLTECSATVDGSPITDGTKLPDSPGPHTFTISAKDTGGNTDVHSLTYTVKGFADIYRADDPIAYYRLGDTGTVMADASGHGRDGTYKNKQESGPVGISGDGDTARRFWGDGGYGYANSVGAGEFQATVEAWANPDDLRDQSVAGLAGSDELVVLDGRFAYRHADRIVSSGVAPTPGHFTQVVGVWDGDTIKIYVDGTLRGSAPAATGRSTGAGTFYAGFGTLAPWFLGSLDEVAYYGSALSADRVYQHYLADPPADGAKPVTASCRVPALRGLRVTTARTALREAGCRLGAVAHRAAGVRQRGRVLQQSVAAGSKVVAGRSVRITVGR